MKVKLYARQCSVSGEGMNKGWVINGGEFYIAKEKDCKKWLKKHWKMTIEEAYGNEEDDDYDSDAFYWTTWEDIKDYQCIEIDGKVHEISEFFNL
jgi:hypothetical protein